jgi:hypothetical protein
VIVGDMIPDRSSRRGVSDAKQSISSGCISADRSPDCWGTGS